MGSVFGRESVAEPAFDILLAPTEGRVQTSYELRRYGERFAAEAFYTGDDDSPFTLLAGYIGVFGKLQNEAAETIYMTAPVMMKKHTTGTAIAMTAPVMKSTNEISEKTMELVLPAKYDELSKIPRPTNPDVHIKEIPSQVGAVHRYIGRWNDEVDEKMALQLAAQLRKDGVEISDEDAAKRFQFWGYNPPFCLPAFRRNKVWIELTTEQADLLVKEFNTEDVN